MTYFLSGTGEKTFPQHIRIIYRQLYRPWTRVLSKFIVLWSTVTKPGCDELPLSCFFLSCQLSSQTEWTPPVTKREGNLWLHADRGHRTPLLPFLCKNPFKGESLCDQTAGNAAELQASHTTVPQTSTSTIVKHFLPDH